MSKKNSNFVPKRLTRLRIMSNLTQIKLAKKVNISRSCLANYETGKRTPDEDMIKIFADFFNVDSDYFFRISDAQPDTKSSCASQSSINSAPSDDKLDITHISPLSKLALIEFYNFLQERG